MRLFSFSITPNNRKVEAFVRHFDLPVEIHQVSFKDKETQSPEFLAINPMGKVPVLTDGDFALWESNAILAYLATRFPDTHAMPSGPRGRAEVDRWLHWQSCHLVPALAGLKTARGEDVTPIATALRILDERLAGRDYLLDTLSVVDFALGAYLMTKAARQLDLQPYPHVRHWIEGLASLRGFRETRLRASPSQT